MKKELEQLVGDKANSWLQGNFDEQTKRRVRELMEQDPAELTEAFYKNLEFGTGGLRGIMGVGTNRMNTYTVGMATQGLANYIRLQFPDEKISVAVAHDSRKNSPEFARTVAEIFAANGFTVYLFDGLRPTPELSFTVREKGCKSGVMVTASHNPKEYNGYKAYWDDGGQVTAPHDTDIIEEVNKITSPDMVRWSGGTGKIVLLGEEMDRTYLDKLHTLMLSPEAVQAHKNLKIVYTPLHGTGYKLVPQFLKEVGFDNVILVPQQATPDGDFPSVASPNPEEKSALQLAIDLASREGADLVMATDPDADRVGIAIRDDRGEFVLVNGNQTASLLTYYCLRRWSELGRLTGTQYIVKTIVTSELLARIARAYGVEYFDVLTGFKHIATVIREQEVLGKTFICGGEESYGFLVGSYVRDKDAVVSCAMVAEMAAWVRTQGTTLYGLLKEIYREYGFFKESLLSLTMKGKEGAEEIQQMMAAFRATPPTALCGSPVVQVLDYEAQVATNLVTGAQTPIDLPRSNVLQFVTEDSTIVSARPSGTEPKIKFYFGVREELPSVEQFHTVEAALDAKIEALKQELNLIK
ncbi:MAG: phospho-sugar mutase [Rikenellaceae bacterium]|jgi:phosphoglucomutase|nr:phospho-sugar mutase [Rikenellaceae bacterium]